jgi:signal transduction histidine kinase
VWLYSASGEVLAASPNAALAPAMDPRSVLAQPSEPPYDPIVRIAPPYTIVEPGEGAFGLTEGPDGGRWRVYVLPIAPPAPGSGGQPSTAFAVGEAPLRDIDAAASTARRLVPLLAVVSAVAMVGAGMLLASRALRPVAALTETAHAIARARELGRRVPVSGRDDELGQMAATFNAMLDSLERAYRMEQRFVADASHELRTPLTSVQANLDVLERRPDLPAAERQEALREASRETRRLVRLVADLLVLARADAGLPLARRRVLLDQVILEVLDQARHLARGQELTVEALESLAVDGDADRLKQLFLALVDNAVKYTPPTGTISLALRRHGSFAEVVVRDTGVGVAAEELPRAFERFYRGSVARARDPEGTGLGLSIAQWIATQHGGEITLSSQPGRGTTASVRLPLSQPLSTALPAAAGAAGAQLPE